MRNRIVLPVAVVLVLSISGFAVGAESTADLSSQISETSFTATQANVSASASGPNVSSVAQGGAFEIQYTLRNTGDEASVGLVAFPPDQRPDGITVVNVSGDVSRRVLGASPPGIITDNIPPGESVTVTAVYAVAATAESGDRRVVVNATVSADGTPVTEQVGSTVSVTGGDGTQTATATVTDPTATVDNTEPTADQATESTVESGEVTTAGQSPRSTTGLPTQSTAVDGRATTGKPTRPATETPDSSQSTETATPTETSSGTGPGFTPVATVLAVLALVALVGRRN